MEIFKIQEGGCILQPAQDKPGKFLCPSPPFSTLELSTSVSGLVLLSMYGDQLQTSPGYSRSCILTNLQMSVALVAEGKLGQSWNWTTDMWVWEM